MDSEKNHKSTGQVKHLKELSKMLGQDNVHKVGDGKYVITSHLVNVEFWKGEYAKRRLFIENKEGYGLIVEMMIFLNDICCEILNKRSDISCKFADPYFFEMELLLSFGHYQSLSKILKTDLYELVMQKYPDAENLIRNTYELSVKYGYILTDLEITTKEDNIEKHYLVKIIEQNEHSFWKNHKSELKDEEGYDFIETFLVPRKFFLDDSCKDESENISIPGVHDSGDDLINCIKNDSSCKSEISANSALEEIVLEFEYLSMQIAYAKRQQHQIKKEIFNLLCNVLGMNSSIDALRGILPCICMESETLCDSDIDYLQTLILGPSSLDSKGKCQNLKKHKFTCKITGSSTPFYTNCCCVNSISKHLNEILSFITIRPEDKSKLTSNIFPDSFFKSKNVKYKLDNYIMISRGMAKQVERVLLLHQVLEKGNMRSNGLVNRALGLVVWDAINIHNKSWKEIFNELNVVGKNKKGFASLSSKDQEQFNKKLQTGIYKTTRRCINESVFLTLP